MLFYDLIRGIEVVSLLARCLHFPRSLTLVNNFTQYHIKCEYFLQTVWKTTIDMNYYMTVITQTYIKTTFFIKVNNQLFLNGWPNAKSRTLSILSLLQKYFVLEVCVVARL